MTKLLKYLTCQPVCLNLLQSGFTHWGTNINFPCCNCLNPSYFQFASFFCHLPPWRAIWHLVHIFAKNNVRFVVYSFKSCSLKAKHFSHFQLNPTVTNSVREVGEYIFAVNIMSPKCYLLHNNIVSFREDFFSPLLRSKCLHLETKLKSSFFESQKEDY